MATPRVLRFDAEGRPLEFSVWLLRAHRLLESQVHAYETMWAHASDDLPEPADPAPLAADPTPADSDRYSRKRADVTAWKSRDAAACIALSSILPESEETHFTQVRTASEFLTAIKACYATPTTVSLGRLFLPFLFPDLASFERTADLIIHMRSLDSSYRAACTDAQLALLPPPIVITIYFIATSLAERLASVRDALLLKHPSELTIDVLESALKDVESNLRSVAFASGVAPPPLFHRCTVPQLPTFTASLAIAATDVTAAAVATSSRSRGRSGRRGGQGAGGGGGGDVASGGGGSAGAGGAPRAATGDSPSAAGGGDAQVCQPPTGLPAAGGGAAAWYLTRRHQQQPLPSQQPQQQQRLQQVSGQGSGQRQLQRNIIHPPCTYHVLTGACRSQPCGRSRPSGQCFAQLTDTVRLAYSVDGPAPDWLPLFQTYGPTLWGMSASQLVDLLGTPHAMYAVVDSSASDSVYSSVVSLGASLAEVPVASVGTCVDTSPGAAPEDASLSFTLDSGASHCFFRDRTTLTSLPMPVSVALADPTSGPITARYTTTLPCPAVPSGSLTGFHVPSFSRNLVGVRPLVSEHVGVWIEPSGETAVAVSGQVPVSGLVAASCSCQSLAHPTVLWHHRMGHPSISRLRAMSSQRLVLGLLCVLPSLPPSLAPPCGPCVKGRLRATPHSSLCLATEPFKTLHLDVWGPASRPGLERESFFLVVVDDYSRYTTVFPLAKKSDVTSTLIRWLLTTADSRGRRISCLHSDRGGVSHATPPPSVAPQVQPPSPQYSSKPTGAGFRGEDPGGASSRGAGVGAWSVPVKGPGSWGAGVGAEPVTAGDSSLRGAGVSGAVHGGATIRGAPSAGPGEPGTDPVTSGGAGFGGGATGSLESGPRATTAPDTIPPPHPYPTRHQARPQQQQPPPPPVSGLRTISLPSPSPPPPPSPPISGPPLPPPDPSPAVFPPPLPPLSPPLSHTWPSRHSPRARPSSPDPFTDLRTALFCSSPPRLSPSVLPSPPESALTAFLSNPVIDYYRTYRPVLARVLASLNTDPRASLSPVSALTAAVTEFVSTRFLDYATSLVVAPPTSPLAIGGECALGCDALEDRQFELEFLAASSPHLLTRPFRDELFEPSGPYAELVGCLMSTHSSLVSISTAEVEIYAGAMAAQQLCWLTFLLTDLSAARRTPCTPFFEGCSPSPLAPSYASAAAVDVPGAKDIRAASASAKRRSSKGKGSRGGGGGSSGGGGGSGGGGSGGSGGGSGGFGGGGGGSGGSGGRGSGGSGGGRTRAQCGGSGGGQRQQQQRRSKTPSPQELCEWLSQRGASGGSSSCPYVIRTGDRAGQTCGMPHTQHRCLSRLDDAWCTEFGDEAERPCWAELLRSGVAIFDLDYDAILSAMYALCVSAEGDCYLCVPPNPGIEATSLGASESSLPGTVPAEALHTFTLDSGASRCFFRDSTTLTPLPALVPVRLADPSGGPVVARSSSVLPCPAVPSSSLSGLHLPSFSMNWVASPCSCRLLSHQTLLWHHHLGHPSLPRLRGMHSRLLVSGLPRSLPPLPPSLAPPCLPCVEGRQRAPPHSSSFPSTTAPLQTFHMDVWGPACVSGEGRECYFLLVVDEYTCYTTVFPLRSKGEVLDVLIPWIRAVRLRLGERFGQDLPVLHLHSNIGVEFSSTSCGTFVVGRASPSPSRFHPLRSRIGLLSLNLWPRVSLPETSPTLRWTGEVGDASVFQVWGSRAFVRDTSADKLSARAIPCVFLGFPPDAPGWQFYHPISRRIFPSQDVMFDKSVPFYRLFPYRSAPPPLPPLFLAPGPPPVDPLPPQGPAPSSVSEVDPLPGTVPVEVARDSSASRGATSGGVASGGAEPKGSESGGAERGGAEPGGAEPGGAETAGVEPWGAEPEGVELGGAESEGAGSRGAGPRGTTSAGGVGAGDPAAGDIRARGARVIAGAGGTGGAAAARSGGARTKGSGAAGTGVVGGAGAGDHMKPRATEFGGVGAEGPGAGGARGGGAGAGGTGARGAGVGGAGGAGAGGAGGTDAGGTVPPRPCFVPLLERVLGVPSSTALNPPLLCPPLDESQLPLQPTSPLPAPSPHNEQTRGLSPESSTVHVNAITMKRAVAAGADVGGEFSSDLLRDFCRGEGILQTFTLPDSPQQNGIAERRIGLVMEVTRTSMIHAAAPHFLWPFAVQYAAHQLNLWPRVSLPETSPTLRWTGEVGDASVFRVWGSRAFVRDMSADKISARAIPCVFLGFVPDAPGWQFYHPTSRRVVSSQDVMSDKSVPFYRLFPYHSAPPPPPPLFLAPGPPPVDPLPPPGPAPSGVSQVDPLTGPATVQVAVDSGAARGATFGGAASGGAELGGAESEGAEPEGVEPGGAASEGVECGGAEPQGAASSGGSAGASPRLSPQQLREWFFWRARLPIGATRAGGAGARGTGVAAGAGVTGGTATTGPGGPRTRGTGAAGSGGVEGAGAGDPTESGAAGAGGSGTRGAGAGGAGGARTGVGGAGVGGPSVGGAGAGGAGAVDLGGAPASPLPAPSPYTEQSGGLSERREPASRPVSPVRRAPCSRPPPIPGTHAMTLPPSSVFLRVPLPALAESSLPEVPDLESDRARAASSGVSRLLATAVIDPSFESAAAFALVAELLDFAAAYRLDYATALVAESASASPPSIRGECALGTDVLEDRQEVFEGFATALPHLVSMLLAAEGDPDAPDIPTPRSYIEVITGPSSSQWQEAMDAEMASWKSTGTYVDEVPPPGTNIVDGMWIFRVKRPPGSPPAFKACYVARGFSQRQGVNFF
ncbi:unnamed protein product [Closterium sp. NIES-54]